MKVPITIVLDLNDYVSNYEFNKRNFTKDIFEKVKNEIKDIVVEQLNKKEIKEEVTNSINDLDFQLVLRNFINENKEKIINEIVRLLGRKEEIYKNIYKLKEINSK